LKRLAMATLALLAAGLAVTACSSTPAAQSTTTTSTRTTASTTTTPLPPTTSTTTAENASCFQVFAGIGAITSANIKAEAAPVADNCSPTDLHDVVNARVEFTAHGRPLNAVGQALVAGAVSIAERAACPSNPHTKLCP
jgi:pectin methylesterase-like acyl-CoA thioesterase